MKKPLGPSGIPSEGEGENTADGDAVVLSIRIVWRQAVSPEGSSVNGTAMEEMGIKPDFLVQEYGYDEDVDFELREAIEEFTGEEIFDEEDHEVVDTVLLWWRDGDGDLVDMLVDCQSTLEEGGVVWLLTPKKGRDLHVSAADIAQAAPTAGLHVTTSAGVSENWSATRLVGRRNPGERR